MPKPNALPTYSKDNVLYADEGLSDLTPVGVIISSGTLISGALTFGSLVGDIDTANGAFSETLTVSGIPVDISAGGGPGAGVSSLNSQQGAITLQGQGGTTITTVGQTITISGATGGGSNDHSALNNLDFASSGHTGFASEAALTTTSGHLQNQIDGIDDHPRYTDAEAVSGTEAARVTLSGHLQSEIDLNASAILQLDGEVGALDSELVTVSGHLQDQIDNLPASSGTAASVNALQGSDGITVISGSNVDTIQGFRPEFIAASGSLQTQIDSIDTGSSTGGKALVGSDGITVVSGSNQVDIQGFRGEFVSASGTLQSQIDSNSSATSINTSNIADNTSQILTTSGHLQNQIDSIQIDELEPAIVGQDGITVTSGTNTTLTGFRPEFVAASGSLQSQIDSLGASELDTAIVGSDGIAVVSGSNEVEIQGFRNEFVASSGSLQNQIDNLDDIYATDAELVSVSGHLQSQITGSSDLQSAYDAGDGIITTSSGKPAELDGTGELVAVTGTFTQGLTIGSTSVDIYENSITIDGDRVVVEPDFVSASGYLDSRITSMDPNGISFKGAIVSKTNNQNLPSGANTPVNFQSVQYDHGGWFDASQPTRFTVPSGVSRVVVFANVSLENSGATGKQQVKITRNDQFGQPGFPIAGHAQETSSSDDLYNVCTAPIEVTPGDYFEVQVFHNQGAGIDVFGTGNTWFGIAADRTGFEIPLVGAGNVTVVSGTDVITISGSGSGGGDLTDAIVGAGGNTVISGSNTVTVSGFRDEFVLASGSLQGQLDSHTGDATLHFTEASIDHTNIQNVGSNTHAQIDSHISDSTIHFTEGSIDHDNIQNNGSNSHAEIDTHLAALATSGTTNASNLSSHTGDSTIHFTEGSIDHGSISGLGDDDHTQYTRADGTRAFTGDQSFGSNNITDVDTLYATLISGSEDATLGDAGFEGDGVVIDGTLRRSVLKSSDIGSNRLILIHKHRHDTTFPPAEAFSRSNTDDNSHAAVTNGQALGRVYYTGYADTGYEVAGMTEVTVDDSGAISDSSMPGVFNVRLNDNGSAAVNPPVVVSVSGSGGMGVAGGITAQSANIGTGTFTESLTISGVAVDIASGDVTDYGATGDGVTDDTAAIQAAMDAGGVIVVPSGVYSINQVDVTSKVDVRASSGAVFRQRSTGDENIACIRFTTGSDGSTWDGGQFDGDASTHASSYTGSTETNKRVWTGIRVDGAPANLRFRNIHMYDFLMSGFWHQNANQTVWENILIERCGKAFICQRNDSGRLANIVCHEIQNRNKAIFQHAIEIRDATNLTVLDIVVTDFQPDNAGVEPTPGAIAFERMRGMTAVGLSADGFSGSGKAGIGFIIDTLEKSSVTGLLCRDGYESAATVNTCWDSAIDHFHFDLAYEDTIGGGAEGIRIRGGGLFPAIGDGTVSENARANEGCRNLRLSNGLVMRAVGQGYLVQSGFVQFVNCHALGNTLHGFQSNENLTGVGTFSGGSAVPVTNVDLLGCSATYNGLTGFFVEEGASMQIIGGSYSNNGSDTTGGNQRAGIRLQNASKIRIVDADLGDTQDWATKSPGASFEPGSTTNNQFDLSLVDPSFVQVGQYLVLKNADGSGDVTAKVIDKRRDDITVETSSPVTFSATGNTSALTGTISTTGVTVNGTSTAFLTELTGRTYIVNGGNYRRVIRVNSDTSAVIEEAFPSDLSGASVSKLEIDVDPSSNNRQQFGIRMETAASGIYVRGLYGEVSNTFWNFAATADQGLEAGSEVLGTVRQVASASSMSVPKIQNGFFRVTGTNSIQTIPAHPEGSQITLLFNSTADVEHNAGNILLQGASDWTTISTNDTLTLISDGVNWVEVGRSDNS
ncbi:MAG: hypothetical protein GF334_01595 [Candidatus Altiarchaeales archaeon]|nr:hypothetical protein [Candidatus Altiarchaeales archaeon]